MFAKKWIKNKVSVPKNLQHHFSCEMTVRVNLVKNGRWGVLTIGSCHCAAHEFSGGLGDFRRLLLLIQQCPRIKTSSEITEEESVGEASFILHRWKGIFDRRATALILAKCRGVWFNKRLDLKRGRVMWNIEGKDRSFKPETVTYTKYCGNSSLNLRHESNGLLCVKKLIALNKDWVELATENIFRKADWTHQD